ncbi:MAG: hypothetical protein M1827_004899 [Pycnora praestabilis]|nr:MAG: hypothetical protein M1827_004899 [Pycnora praestabilis]
MTLCSNRPEGFGPSSHLYPHILTSCFIDTILVPLPTWTYFSNVLILLVVFTRRTTQRKSSYDSAYRTNLSPSRTHRILTILYSMLLVAEVLMLTIENARLGVAKLGVGLLPFTYFGILLVGCMHFSDGLMDRVRGWRWANVGFWMGLVVANVIKVVEEAKEREKGVRRARYPVSDQMTDVGVMLGLFAVSLGLEISLKTET